jgi:hypothetical protein
MRNQESRNAVIMMIKRKSGGRKASRIRRRGKRGRK